MEPTWAAAMAAALTVATLGLRSASGEASGRGVGVGVGVERGVEWGGSGSRSSSVWVWESASLLPSGWRSAWRLAPALGSAPRTGWESSRCRCGCRLPCCTGQGPRASGQSPGSRDSGRRSPAGARGGARPTPWRRRTSAPTPCRAGGDATAGACQATRLVGVQIGERQTSMPGSGGSSAVRIPSTKIRTSSSSSCVPTLSSRRRRPSSTATPLR